MAKLEMFSVGKEKIPNWFNEEARKGRCKINKGDDDELINIVIYGPTGANVANIGDSIMKTKSGMLVIPEEKAKKYNVQKNISVNKDVNSHATRETT